jgi:acyl-CoA synthetase (AMP-forming)/AMP-acid ligase II
MEGQFVDVVTAPARRTAYVASGAWDDTTLAGQVAHHAVTRGDRVAVVDETGRRTFVELARDAAAFAAALVELGVGAGGVVSLQLPNRYETVVAAVAVQSLGAVVNPLLPNYRAHELEHVWRTARPSVVVVPDTYRDHDHRSLAREVASRSGVDPHVVVVGNAQPGQSSFAGLVTQHSSAAGALRGGRAAAVSEVIFTSGTEAQPKAIMHTEQTTNFSVRAAFTDLGMGHTDLGMADGDDHGDDHVVWMPSPVGHSTGFNYGLRFALYHGLPLVLQDRWDAATALDLVTRERCTYTLAATTFLQDLVECATATGRRVPRLTRFGCGGAPVPPRLVDAASDVGIGVLRLYGSTEVLVGSWNRPGSSTAQKRDTDGVAMTGVELQVVDDDGAGTSVEPVEPVAPGTPGELVTRGPNTCVGFFADPERTAAVFSPDGWVRSGDTVTMDGDGYVTVVGRKKEILIRGGINIAPREIEDVLLGFPEVERAAVVGLPDERLGERTCACVVLRPGATLDLDTVVARFEAAGVATYKWPQRLELLAELPATASGKIKKHVIVAALVDGTKDEDRA